MAKQKRSEGAEARRFAVILSILLGLFAVLSWWRHHPTRASVLLAVALAALTFALVLRPVWESFYRVWMKLAFGLAWLVTRVLLTALYYGFITPYGLVARVFRKDPLNLSWKSRRATYWVDKAQEQGGPERYERQF